MDRYDAVKIRNDIQSDRRTNDLDAWNYLNITSRFPHLSINKGKINKEHMVNSELVDDYITRKIFG